MVPISTQHMNNRDYKIFAEGEIFHIYNRGVGKMDIFESPDDYSFFLYRMKENLSPELVSKERRAPSPGGYVRKLLPSGSFTLLAYCLMPNHFHLVIRQNTTLPISTFMLKLCGGYSKNFNATRDRVGSVFQDQFKSVLVDSDEYLRWISAYVHSNPKVAGLVTDLKDYPWSSYVDYVGQRNGVLCKKDVIINSFKDITEYVEFVESAGEIIKERKDMDHLFLD